jgi:hypothetical protein
VGGYCAEPNEQVLKVVPADVLFCARVKNLEYSASMIDQFAVGISPMPLATSMMVRTQLARILGNPELAGVNMAGSFAVFATVEPNQTIPDIYMLIPITDYNRVADVNTNVGQRDANGVSALTLEGRPTGYMTKVGGYGLLARQYGKCLWMGKSLSAANAATLFKSLGPVEVKQADGDLIWVYGNIQKASKTYGPMLLDQIEQLKKAFQKRPEAASPMDIGFIMDMYGRLAKTLLDEGKTLTIATSPKPDLLLVKTTFKALPGTETAGILTADVTASRRNNLGGFLEDGAVMNFIGQMNNPSMKKMNVKFIDLMAQMVGRDPNADEVVKIKKLAADLIDSYGGPFAFSMSGEPNAKPPFGYKYVIAVKDANGFDKVTDEFTRIWSGSVIDEFMKKMGMETTFTVKHGVDKYKGTSISSANFGMKWGDGNSPETQMLNNMYGEGMDYRWAVVKGLWICTTSGDANALYKLIDQVNAGAPAVVCSEMQKAMGIMPDANNADVLVTYNYLRLFKMMAGVMPMPMPQINIMSKSNLVFTAKVRNGSATVDIGVPKEHLVEMMTVFQMMMQQQMQQQMQKKTQQPGAAPPMMPQPAPLAQPNQPGE